MRKLMLAVCVLGLGAASPVLAANADRPYANCDKKVDNCGPTGNETTDQLNAAQLSSPGMPMSGAQTMPMQGQPAPMPMSR